MIIFILLLVLLAQALFTNIRKRGEKRKKILQTKAFTKARIIRFYYESRSPNLVYVYRYQNKEYRDCTGTTRWLTAQKQMINTEWPVILSNVNPESNEILITKRDFKNFNLQRPDTLINVEE